jgi:GAF domain-containing protein
MAENIYVEPSLDRKDQYKHLLPQIDALIGDEKDIIANQANFVAALKQAFGFFWIGFYRKHEQQLVLGPFQGPVACTRIGFGKGVCGRCWETEKPVLVPDVELFPGHIACSSLSKSELVMPCFIEGRFYGVLDIDSDKLNDFSASDIEGVEMLLNHFASRLFN